MRSSHGLDSFSSLPLAKSIDSSRLQTVEDGGSGGSAGRRTQYAFAYYGKRERRRKNVCAYP